MFKWLRRKKMEETKNENAGVAAEAETVNESQPQSEVKAEAEVKAETETETKAEAKSEAEVKKESETEVKAETKSAEPDWKDLYARLRADFDNYKKRAARDREDVYRYAEGDILKDVIPTVDNLQLALSKVENKDDAFVKGVQMVLDNLLKALKDHGAEPFDSVGKELDTERMEAIANLPSPDVEEGKVSIESKKGWLLKDKVLRAAQVVISSGKMQ